MTSIILTLATGSVFNMNGGNLNLVSEGTVQVNAQIFGAGTFFATAGQNVNINGAIESNQVEIEAGLLDNGVTFTYNAATFSYTGTAPSVWVEAPQIAITGPADFSGFGYAHFDATVGNLTTTGNVLSANLEAAGSILGGAGEISGGAFMAAGNDNSGGSHLGAGQILAGGNIQSGGDIFSPYVWAGGGITVGGDVSVQNLTSGDSLVVDGQIRPHIFATAATDHVFDVFDMTSGAGIAFQGMQAGGSQPATDGRRLTVTTQSLITQHFNPSTVGTGYINGQADFRGGDGNIFYPLAGNGGYFSFNPKGGIFISDYQILTGPGYAYTVGSEGNGGTILLTTGTQFDMSGNSTLQAAGPAQSKSGGLVSVLSQLTSGVGIQITDSSQLLAITTAAATTGSRIELRTQGADINADGGASTVNLNTGQTTAKVNQVLIDTGGVNGWVDLNQVAVVTDLLKVRGQHVTLNSAVLTASTVKIYTTGSLTFGSGNAIYADTIVLSSPSISVINPITISGSPTVNVYSSSTLSGANFTGGTPVINNMGYGSAPAF